MRAATRPLCARGFRRTRPTSATSAARSKPRPISRACASSLGIDLDDARLLDGWNVIFVEEMPGIARLLARAAAKIPVYAFTNTNRAHADRFLTQFAPLLAHFRKVFTSHDLGLRKPEPAAFARVVSEIGVPAGRILFFDDSAENVAGARASGLQAVHVTSDTTVADTLAALKL